ncbi:MAG: hypothetical protein J1G38_04540 [Clostridiales bacterium]|nr:hypothetical protein [Clostridiales bacterium]
MKISLGIHVKHDRGACLIVDGKIIVNIANERLDRIKYSASPEIPYKAIDAVLKYANIQFDDISCIGMSGAGIEANKIKQFYKDELFSHYGIKDKPFFFISHHLAHAYSVYYSSSYNDSIIFVADGGGDYFDGKQEAESLYYAHNGKIQLLSSRMQDLAIRKLENPINHTYPFMPDVVREHQISLARKYAQITHFIGFGYGECGKTMGLASYGDSYFDYSDLDYKDLNFTLKYKDIVDDIYAKKVVSNKTFKEFLRNERHNIAATVQSFTERALISLLKNIHNKYPCDNLCLSGGIFLNCLINHKILRECNFTNVFILPAAGDDGQALGSAYYAYTEMYGYQSKFDIDLPFIGIDYQDSEIRQAIDSKHLLHEKYSDDDLAKIIAQYIADNKIIGLHRGRTELGPRALCHRSILANPTNPNMKDILNNRVKHREEFRPFAPTVVAEEQFKYFELHDSSNYMLLAPLVKEQYRTVLPSITHVDGTARVQAISDQEDAFIHKVLLELKKLIGVPVVLNTSFNVAGEPIVESPLDALNTFLETDIDELIIGNYVVHKTKE